MKVMLLSQKLVSAAGKAYLLAIVLVGLFSTAPMAFSQSNCSISWAPAQNPLYVSPGHFENFGGQMLVGNIGSWGDATLNVQYQQSGNFTIQSLVVGTDETWPTSGSVAFFPYQTMGFNGQVPSTAANGQSAQVTMTVSGNVGGWSTDCSQTVSIIVQNPCGQKVTEANGNVLTSTFDIATGLCEIEPVPAGATGAFVYNNAYYVDAYKTSTCLPGAGSWDGANCWYMTQPAGGTLWQNSFFEPSAGGSCPAGTTYEASTNNCLVKSAPWGTQAFLYTIGGQVQWYFTPQMTCPIAGVWDSAHCYIMTAPAGKTAILLNNKFYYY